MKLNVLYQSDDNYAVYLGVSMLSLLMNNREAESIDIYVIDDRISEENKKKLRDTAAEYGRSVYFCDAAELHKKAKKTGFDRYNGFRKNRMSYLKMFVSDAVPGSVERLVYIDCDTLVTGDITELMSLDMEGKPVGMVLSATCGAGGKKRVGLKPEDIYCNSGVILFDLERWKKEECLEKIIDHARNERIYGTVDQDFYSVVLKGRIKPIHPKYNLQGFYLAYDRKRFEKVYRKTGYYYSEEEVKEAIASPAIIHFLRFLGEYPLSSTNVHPVRPLFEEYLARSLWKGCERKKAKLGTVMKVERVLYRILPEALFLRVFAFFHEILNDRENRRSLKMSRRLKNSRDAVA